MTLRVAIVEDEAHARAALRILLSKRADAEIVAECRNGAEAVELLRWMRVDLLLLDVQMPGLDGFGVLHALGPRAPATIFVTAFDSYALRAFEVAAVDYLLKPFDEERFSGAFERARRRIEEGRTAQWARRLLVATSTRSGGSDVPLLPRLPVPVGNRILFVPFDDIDWIEAADQYVIVHAGAKEHLLRESLQRLARRLPASRFAQVHRSHVVNLLKVRELAWLRSGDGELTLKDGRTLRVSRRYRDRLTGALEAATATEPRP